MDNAIDTQISSFFFAPHLLRIQPAVSCLRFRCPVDKSLHSWRTTLTFRRRFFLSALGTGPSKLRDCIGRCWSIPLVLHPACTRRVLATFASVRQMACSVHCEVVSAFRFFTTLASWSTIPITQTMHSSM